MLYIKNKIKLLILAIFCFTGLQAQNLNLIEISGIQTPFSINNIRSLSFISGNLYVNLKVGIPFFKVLNDVRSISFEAPNGIIKPSQTLNRLQLFPNPTSDFLNIGYQTDETTNIDLKIISIDGRVIYADILTDKSIFSHRIDISSLQNGLYFVILNNGKTVISEKFIKN